MKEGAHIVVGNPSRINDSIRREFLNTRDLKIIVFDEIDEMLCRGFYDIICECFKEIPSKTQICFFTSTISNEMMKMAHNYMNDPAYIKIRLEEKTLEGIKQYFVFLEKEELKLETLYEFLKTIDMQQCLIYCNSKVKVNEVSIFLKSKKFSSMAYNEIDSAKEFQTGQTRIMVGIDDAFGIFNNRCSLIINFDFPDKNKKSKYIDRIGRSGRFGKKGYAVNFIVGADELKSMLEIEKYYGTSIEELPVDISDIF